MSDFVYKKKKNTKDGVHALINNKSNNNSAFGFKSLNQNTTGTQNSALGSNSLLKNKTGLNNTAVGFNSLMETNSKSNTALGALTGLKLKNGNRNILIGRGANVSKENAMNQIVIGSNSVGHGDNKMVLGNNNLISIDPAVNGKINLGSKEYKYDNIYIGGNIYKDGSKVNLDGGGGASSINNLTDGITNSTSVFLGTNSGSSISLGTNNTATGINSLQANTTGSGNTALGHTAGDKITTGNNNVIIGKNADVDSEDAENQIVIGQGALSGMNNTVTLGNGDVTNVFMGQQNQATVNAGGFIMYNSGSSVYSLPTSDGSANQVLQTNGNGTISFATISLNDLSDATTNYNQYNIGIGYLSLYNNTSGSRNTAVGYQSLYNNTSGNRNTASGYKSLENNTSGYYNTAVGYYSLNRNTIGTNNTAFGFGAGDLITTGSNNVIIGYNADVSAEGVDNEIVIGNGAAGVGTNVAVIGNTSVKQVQTGSGSNLAGVITESTGSDPSTTPNYIGEMVVDTNSSKAYIAKGTTSSSDWIALN